MDMAYLLDVRERMGKIKFTADMSCDKALALVTAYDALTKFLTPDTTDWKER